MWQFELKIFGRFELSLKLKTELSLQFAENSLNFVLNDPYFSEILRLFGNFQLKNEPRFCRGFCHFLPRIFRKIAAVCEFP